MYEPRASACPDLTTEDNRTPITLGQVLWNYYDGEWVVVTAMPQPWTSDGWFLVKPLICLHLGAPGTGYSLNGVRVACRPPRR